MFLKIGVLKISQYSQKNNRVGVSNKLSHATLFIRNFNTRFPMEFLRTAFLCNTSPYVHEHPLHVYNTFWFIPRKDEAFKSDRGTNFQYFMSHQQFLQILLNSNPKNYSWRGIHTEKSPNQLFSDIKLTL